MACDMGVLPDVLIDASDIIVLNRGFIEKSEWALQNIHAANAAIDVLRAACDLKLDQPDEVAVLRLAIRLINSSGAAGDALMSGYYQPGAAHIRDLIEIGFLLDYFRRDPMQVTRWRTTEKSKRFWDFRAAQLRKDLNALDGDKHKFRDQAYAFFSSHGTHADPDSIVLNSPNNWTSVGPFPDRDRSIGLSFDLARYLAAATEYFIIWLLKQRAVQVSSTTERLSNYIEAFRSSVDVMATRQTDPRA
jgi:hypothetical protein